MKYLKKKKLAAHMKDDESGVVRAVRDFNAWNGPAKIWLDRNNLTVSVTVYKPGADTTWGEMGDSPDFKEIYRKSTEMGDVQTNEDEIRGMIGAVGPFRLTTI